MSRPPRIVEVVLVVFVVVVNCLIMGAYIVDPGCFVKLKPALNL